MRRREKADLSASLRSGGDDKRIVVWLTQYGFRRDDGRLVQTFPKARFLRELLYGGATLDFS
jgi:hypothetical protein